MISFNLGCFSVVKVVHFNKVSKIHNESRQCFQSENDNGKRRVEVLINSRDQKLFVVILCSEIKIRRIEFTNAILLSL